jgi:PAS domain S-box-containing protein
MTEPLKVLILEDDQTDALLMVSVLEKDGYVLDWERVEKKDDYVQGINQQPDLILADFSLPQFDAFKALEVLNAQSLDIPLIVVSGAISEETAIKCIKQGAADYLIKDRLARLGNAVQQALDEQRLREEKARAENALEESEERYRSVVEDSPGLICRFLPGGSITFANEAYCKYFGKKFEEVVGEDFFSSIIEEDRDRVMENISSLSQGSPLLTQEQKVITPSGEIRWQRWTNRALFNSQGQITGYQSYGEDITEHKRGEIALKRRADELAGLFEASRVFLSELQLEAIQQNICQTCTDFFGLKMSWLGLLEPDSFNVYPTAASGLEDGYLDSIRVTWDDSPTGQGPIGTAIRTKKPSITNDIANDPEYAPWREIALARGYQSAAALPLSVSENVLGVLKVYSDQPAYFTPNRIQPLQSLANLAAVAIENATLFEQVNAGRKRHEVLSRSLVEVQELERRNISRELHDEIGQALTGLKLTIGSKLRSQKQVAPDDLNYITEQINELIALVRNISLSLRPAMLDDAGLLHALLWHLDRFNEQTGIDVDFTPLNLEEDLPPDLSITVYRIVQEALTNVARYAGVTEAVVKVESYQDTLSLIIEDQGKGFDLESKTGEQTVGLSGMQERVELVGGRFNIFSTPGFGTRIFCEFPLVDRREPLDRRNKERSHDE